jgi:hypothetical protein
MTEIQKLRELVKQRPPVKNFNYEYSLGTFTLPKIKKTFAPLNVEELVSVQPMNLPAGLVFYMDYKK